MWVTTKGNSLFRTHGQQYLQQTSKVARRRQQRRKKILLWTGIGLGAFGTWKALDIVKTFWENKDQPHDENKQKIVLIGTGFGAISVLSELDCDRFDVSVVSPRDHFLYTPLLAAATVGAVSMESVAESIRDFAFRRGKDITYYAAVCDDINLVENTVSCTAKPNGEKFSLPYDQLVLSFGAKNKTYGIPGMKHCTFLRSLSDAHKVRMKILSSLEASSVPGVTDEQKAQLLSIVIVGGGPVATEAAIQMQYFLAEQVSGPYSHLKGFPQVSIISSTDHISNFYDHQISNYYRKSNRYKRSGVTELENLTVLEIGTKSITVKEETGNTRDIPYGTCLWLTGNGPHPLVRTVRNKLPNAQSSNRSLQVKNNLQLLGTKNVYAIGDCSDMPQPYLVQNLDKMFDEADANHDGVLSFEEVERMMIVMSTRYPEIMEVRRKVKKLFEKADVNADQILSREEFQQFLLLVDKRITRFPTTASVAVQQGQYVARQFNSGSYKELSSQDDISVTQAFRYKHIGGYEYVGAALGKRERGSKGDVIMKGFGAWWLWNNVYFSSLVGLPMRLQIAGSELLATIFGNQVQRE